MSTKIVKVEPGEGRGSRYEVDAGGLALAVDIYPGDPGAPGERPWHVDIRFVADEEDLTGGDVSPRSAFLAAVSRHETWVRAGHPLPAVSWSEVEHELERAGAFPSPSRP